ncbi:Uncharacterised protein [Shigella sonnei]|nr:Uncharacterised protein [Shigella sonnei]
MVWLLGDWNKPNPAPHKIIGQIILISAGDAGSRTRGKSPAAMMNNPRAPSNPACTRSIK